MPYEWNHEMYASMFSAEGVQQMKEMLYEEDEEYRRDLLSEMDSTIALLESIRNRDELIREDNATLIRADRQPSPWYVLDCKYQLLAPWDIRDALDDAEEDADYEEWINSKEYKDSLQKYNRHKLLAWNKEENEHPKWSGEYKEHQQTGVVVSGKASGHVHGWLGISFIKERYRVAVNVHTLNCGPGGTWYAYGSTPYGDVYIPEKITNYLKDSCGSYDMDIALQDVEGAPGKGPNSFPWTCVYLHNKGFALE